MGVVSDPAFSRGDVMREIRELKKQVRDLAAARRLESSTIGAGGVTIKGGALTILDEAGQTVAVVGKLPDGTYGIAALDASTADLVSLSTLAFGIRGARVLDSESTNSFAFTDLGTPGPSVDVTIGPSRRAIVFISVSSSADPDASAGTCVEVSGASSISPDSLAEATAFIGAAITTSPRMDASAMSAILVGPEDGLNPGLNTFTLKYSNGKSGGGTVFFKDRKIVVFPY